MTIDWMMGPNWFRLTRDGKRHVVMQGKTGEPEVEVGSHGTLEAAFEQLDKLRSNRQDEKEN